MHSELAIWSDDGEPLLHNGDRFSQAEFHALYEQAPDDFEAELIGGIVFIRSPRPAEYEEIHRRLSAILLTYQLSTEGLEVCENATVILETDAEPQPDLLLRRLDDFGGSSTTQPDGYIHGPPELVIEIARSDRSIELHAKREDYRRCGVAEYLVYLTEESRLRSFNLKTGNEAGADPDGIVRIKHFPGLWIDETAVVFNNQPRLMTSLQRGLTQPENQALLEALAALRQPEMQKT